MTTVLHDMFDSVSDRQINTNKPPASGIIPKKSPAVLRSRPDTRTAANAAVLQKPGLRSRAMASTKMYRSAVSYAIYSL